MGINFLALGRLLRPKQWVKNGFVFAGIIFGAQFRNFALFEATCLAAIAFCFMGSSVYVLNDYLDLEADRAHPTKRNRPLASGEVSPAQGFVAAVLCLSLSLASAWFADPRVLLIVLIY